MLQLTTLEMPLQLLSKKNNNKKKKKNSSNHGKQARSDWPSLVASSNFSSFSKTLKAEPRCPPPTCSLFFVDTPKTSSYVFIKKKTQQQILGKTHILNDQVFTKSTTNQLYCRKKE